MEYVTATSDMVSAIHTVLHTVILDVCFSSLISLPIFVIIMIETGFNH